MILFTLPQKLPKKIKNEHHPHFDGWAKVSWFCDEPNDSFYFARGWSEKNQKWASCSFPWVSTSERILWRTQWFFLLCQKLKSKKSKVSIMLMSIGEQKWAEFMAISMIVCTSTESGTKNIRGQCHSDLFSWVYVSGFDDSGNDAVRVAATLARKSKCGRHGQLDDWVKVGSAAEYLMFCSALYEGPLDRKCWWAWWWDGWLRNR